MKIIRIILGLASEISAKSAKVFLSNVSSYAVPAALYLIRLHTVSYNTLTGDDLEDNESREHPSIDTTPHLQINLEII